MNSPLEPPTNALGARDATAHVRLLIRLASILVALGMVAVACSSDDDGVFSLSDDTGIGASGADADGGIVESDVLDETVTFTFDDFDGQSVSFDDLPEGPLVLNFFASWCPPCIGEMPDFETVYQNLAGEVNFLGLATQDRVERAEELVEQTGVTYRVGNDQNGDVFSIFGGLGMPTTVFIDADGTVAKVHTGVLDVDSLTEAINDDLLPGS